jgi:hypothetical protein
MLRIVLTISAILFSAIQLPAVAGDEIIEAGRHDERNDRRDCRDDEGVVGNDKRECKQEEVRDGTRGHQDDRQDDRQDRR